MIISKSQNTKIDIYIKVLIEAYTLNYKHLNLR